MNFRGHNVERRIEIEAELASAKRKISFLEKKL